MSPHAQGGTDTAGAAGLFWHDPLRDERRASRGWISVKRLPVLGLFTNVSLDIG
jgi:hypothetical protein